MRVRVGEGFLYGIDGEERGIRFVFGMLEEVDVDELLDLEGR